MSSFFYLFVCGFVLEGGIPRHAYYSKISQLVKNNSKKNSNYWTCVHGLEKETVGKGMALLPKEERQLR